MTEPCGRPVRWLVRDRRKNMERPVCERHLAWAEQQVGAQTGDYCPLVIVQDGKTGITSGCVYPQAWHL